MGETVAVPVEVLADLRRLYQQYVETGETSELLSLVDFLTPPCSPCVDRSNTSVGCTCGRLAAAQ